MPFCFQCCKGLLESFLDSSGRLVVQTTNEAKEERFAHIFSGSLPNLPCPLFAIGKYISGHTESQKAVAQNVVSTLVHEAWDVIPRR